ncbi:MAG: membrane dipeptidase [Deltaproteobacteria bacterium]|nr:membrane dipeptidase [Deltaproteobacteria bacterium]
MNTATEGTGERDGHGDGRALHEELAVVDLHADTPKLMDVFAYDIFTRHEPPLPGARFLGHVDTPRMREGGLSAQFFGLWTFPYPRSGCARSVMRQLDLLERAAKARPDEFVLCKTAEDVALAKQAGKLAALTGIEGGHALEGRPELVEKFARRGVRYLGLLHLTANDLGRPAHGLGRDDSIGLSRLGKTVIEEMDRVGMILDLAHLNRKGFFEALDVTRGVTIVSHAGAAGVHPMSRNVDDEQVRALADRGGVVGIIFAPIYLGRDGVDAVCDHIVHVMDVGGEDVPALGSDFDGMVRPPKGLEDVSRLPRLTEALLSRGLKHAQVKKILGENVLRVLASSPPKI